MKEKIYYVQSKEDPTALVAIEPGYFNDGRVLTWYDGAHERVIEIKEVSSNEPDLVKIKDRENRIYTFVPMTLDIYNQHVKQHLFAPEDFAREEDMVAAFKKTLGSSNID